VSEIIPKSDDVPALVALLSEQILDVKASIEDLKLGLNDGLRHLEVRLDDHAVRLTNLERAEIRREEAERVRAQFRRTLDEADEARDRDVGIGLSRLQVKIGWIGIVVACGTVFLSELKNII
jgi:hypothetical protein